MDTHNPLSGVFGEDAGRRAERGAGREIGMMTGTKAELIRVEGVRDQEGRDGRIRERKIVLWTVVRDGELLCERETKKEALAYLARINA